MGQHLVLTVRFHGDERGTARYHGVAEGNPEWPPSPARVYQALIAGVARSGGLPREIVPALEWLESLPPPLIAAPHRVLGQGVSLFVPNNDADALDDPRDVSSIRTKKDVRASLFADHEPLLYAWSLSDGVSNGAAIVEAAAQIYQLGRGCDMAWAVGDVMNDEALAGCLDVHPGTVFMPQLGATGGRPLACPVQGSLASLELRHRATKLRPEGTGKNARVVFSNPPKPRFGSVVYERRRSCTLFELRDRVTDRPWPWALHRVVALVERLRDEAAERLRRGLPGHAEQIEGTLVGRAGSSMPAVPSAARARIVPLPSIGFVHADRGIRRFALETASGSPLSSADVEWAFSGLEWADPATGEASPFVVTRSTDEGMLGHYAGPSRRWRSVTPLALPQSAERRRIEPTDRKHGAKRGSERLDEESRAMSAVRHALRHAGISALAVTVRVQREPFEAKGARAESFAEGSRFAKERLWHVDLELDRAVEGPLVIGDGRFLGLGLMAPCSEESAGAHVFQVLDGLANETDVRAIAQALRRAVMARAQEALGPRVALPSFFSGHGKDGGPARREAEPHLAFAFDAAQRRLVILPPHVLERRALRYEERAHLKTLAVALESLRQLRAGRAGCLELRRSTIAAAADELFGESQEWVSQTPYVVTRHDKRGSASEAIAADVMAECRRVGLPTVKVSVDHVAGVDGLGLSGRIRLAFEVSVPGPILIGRDRHSGGGLFSRRRRSST